MNGQRIWRQQTEGWSKARDNSKRPIRNWKASATPSLTTSGRRFAREFVFDVLEQRRSAPQSNVWEITDLHCRKLAMEVYLLTYTLLAGLPSEYSLVVNSDHGGHERSHGADIPEDMLVPWIAVGEGIRPGFEIKSSVGLIDTAPTVARLLGLKPHPDWEGRCIEEMFI